MQIYSVHRQYVTRKIIVKGDHLHVSAKNRYQPTICIKQLIGEYSYKKVIKNELDQHERSIRLLALFCLFCLEAQD